jgi:hypothetical protein
MSARQIMIGLLAAIAIFLLWLGWDLFFSGDTLELIL